MTSYVLGKICSISSGGTPKRSVNDYYFPATIPWVKVGDLGKEIYLSETQEYISKDGLISIGNRTFPKGTILLAMYGATLGKTGIADIELSANQAILGINSLDENILSNKYLKYWLDFNVERFQFKGKGGTYKNLSKTYVSGLTITLPSINQQLTIVQRFEKFQDLIRKRGRSIELLEEYLNSIFFEMFGDPILNPKEYKKEQLEYFGDWKSGGTPPKKKKEYYEKGTIPWFSSGELNDIYVSESKINITKEAIQKTSAKDVKFGSLLIGMYDTAALKTSITKIDSSCNQAIAFSKIDEDLGNTIFILFCIKISKQYFLNKRKGARQKNLNLSLIKSLKIINPSIILQNKFENIFARINNQKELVIKSKQLLDELLQSQIYQTFSLEKEDLKDEIQTILDDKLLVQEFFETIEKSDFQSIEQYNIELEKLRKILIKTNQENATDTDYKKGIVQILKENKVHLRINKEHQNELLDEATEA